VEWLLLAVPIAALIALFGPRRRTSGSWYSNARDWPPDDDEGAGVREPRRPPPHADGAAVALAPPRDGEA
jgi:hypothetical protein